MKIISKEWWTFTRKGEHYDPWMGPFKTRERAEKQVKHDVASFFKMKFVVGRKTTEVEE
jgi:hypothetical protein